MEAPSGRRQIDMGTWDKAWKLVLSMEMAYTEAKLLDGENRNA